MFTEVFETVSNLTRVCKSSHLSTSSNAYYCHNFCVCVCSVIESCPTLCNPMDYSPPDSSVHGIFPGKNTGVGCHFLLQGIFQTQGSNLHLLCLLQWQSDSLPLASPRKPPLSSITLSHELYMTLGGLEVITTVHKRLGGPCVRKPKRLSN